MEIENRADGEAMPLFDAPGETRTETVAAPAVPEAAEDTAGAVAAETRQSVPGGCADAALLPEPTGHFGDYLRMLRQRRNLSLNDLEEATRIRAVYLQAIEDENYAELPPAVYILGYIKNLCRFYGLGEEAVAVLTAEVRQRVDYESPSDSSKVIRDFEPSLENPRMFRRIILAGCGLLIVAAVAITSLIWLFANRGTAAGTAAGSRAVDEPRLLELQPAPVLEDAVLPVSGGVR